MSEPGHNFTATAAAYDGTDPRGSAGLEACGATDDDADEYSSSALASGETHATVHRNFIESIKFLTVVALTFQVPASNHSMF